MPKIPQRRKCAALWNMAQAKVARLALDQALPQGEDRFPSRKQSPDF
jgi:hypothetical protein